MGLVGCRAMRIRWCTAGYQGAAEEKYCTDKHPLNPVAHAISPDEIHLKMCIFIIPQKPLCIAARLLHFFYGWGILYSLEFLLAFFAYKGEKCKAAMIHSILEKDGLGDIDAKI
ncbi:hypothetical protein KDAU_10210 [Dictyobacter aurantiacus]|uniref:Uncharacterized protein n=1 Tax=Dictyobacter aurantiacus TaxID=1936993 RepID=A0A401ZA28_9CHLR|nr:hypothetical protein KDAU_10210 [Dictyobacter aurantiacus]